MPERHLVAQRGAGSARVHPEMGAYHRAREAGRHGEFNHIRDRLQRAHQNEAPEQRGGEIVRVRTAIGRGFAGHRVAEQRLRRQVEPEQRVNGQDCRHRACRARAEPALQGHALLDLEGHGRVGGLAQKEGRRSHAGRVAVGRKGKLALVTGDRRDGDRIPPPRVPPLIMPGGRDDIAEAGGPAIQRLERQSQDVEAAGEIRHRGGSEGPDESPHSATQRP